MRRDGIALRRRTMWIYVYCTLNKIDLELRRHPLSGHLICENISSATVVIRASRKPNFMHEVRRILRTARDDTLAEGYGVVHMAWTISMVE